MFLSKNRLVIEYSQKLTNENLVLMKLQTSQSQSKQTDVNSTPHYYLKTYLISVWVEPLQLLRFVS